MRARTCLIVLGVILCGCRAPQPACVAVRAKVLRYEEKAGGYMYPVARDPDGSFAYGIAQVDASILEIVSPSRWAGSQFPHYHAVPPPEDSHWWKLGWVYEFPVDNCDDFDLMLSTGLIWHPPVLEEHQKLIKRLSNQADAGDGK